MEKVTLCKFCAWMANTDYERGVPNCGCIKAPITDFIDGSKNASYINAEGKCLYYQDRRHNPNPFSSCPEEVAGHAIRSPDTE